MKLFQRMLVAPAALGLLAPISANATEVNLKAISNYSDDKIEVDSNSFKPFSNENPLLISGGEGLVHDHDGGFTDTTVASFGADFVIGQVDGAGTTTSAREEAVMFSYQYGMTLSSSFTGEDSLDLVIETGNGAGPAATILDMNGTGFTDNMVLDGIAYTFPIGDKVVVKVGDSTDVSSVYTGACAYSAFTDRLGDCGTGTSAGLGGGTDDARTASSATIAASVDLGNGFTVAGGFSSAGGDTDGLFTAESEDVYGAQVAYSGDNYGVALSYAMTETTTTTESTFWCFNAFYEFESEALPSVSFGFETEDTATTTADGYMVGLSWDSVGPGSASLGVSTTGNFVDTATETLIYEASYSYPVNDNITVTPGIFLQEDNGETGDDTGFIVVTNFSF